MAVFILCLTYAPVTRPYLFIQLLSFSVFLPKLVVHSSSFVSWSLSLPTPLLAWGVCKMPCACSHTRSLGEDVLHVLHPECNTCKDSRQSPEVSPFPYRDALAVGVSGAETETQPPAGFPHAVLLVHQPFHMTIL